VLYIAAKAQEGEEEEEEEEDEECDLDQGVCTVLLERLGTDHLKLEAEFCILRRQIIGTQVFILLGTEQLDEGGSLVGL
jgi:hypothetical protein